MRVLFVTTHLYLPQRAGGSESSTHDLACALAKRGHSVAILAKLAPRDAVWLKNRLIGRLQRKLVPSDQIFPYRVYRGYDILNNIGEVLADFDPQVVIAQAGRTLPFLYAAMSDSRRTVLYLRDVEFQWLGDAGKLHLVSKVIANSGYVAQKFEARFGLRCDVIPPLIDADAYRTRNTARYCTFINPVPQKGVEIALGLARLNPDIPFQFVEGWPLRPEQLATLKAEISSLSNVVFRRSTRRMRLIYGATKVLLVPSVCEEAWGRVVTEAQLSGIPVLASNVGGLPESVGEGGVLLDPREDLAVWSNHLRRIYLSEDEYRRMSALALERSRKADVSATHLLDKIEKAIL